MAGLTLPRFAVPAYLDKAPAGELHLDLVPLVTMAACMPTLGMFSKAGRKADFVLYTLGFLIADVYHILQLQAHNGLASVHFLGIDGAAWRTLDILSANVLLARTVGHALNVDHPLLAALPNLVLPAVLFVMLATLPGVTLALCARATSRIMFATFVLQCMVGGEAWLRYMAHQYRQPRMILSVVAMITGIVVFALPSWIPDGYWMYHSLWHILMGAGYYGLYQGLISSCDTKADFYAQFAASRGVKPTKARIDAAGLNSKLSLGAQSAESLNEVYTSSAQATKATTARGGVRRAASTGSDDSVDVSPRANLGRGKQRGQGGQQGQGGGQQDGGHFSDSGDSAQEAGVGVQRVHKRRVNRHA